MCRTDLVTVGAFRCPTQHPLFPDSGPIHQPCFVFPRTAVVIEHENTPPFMADPTVVTLYRAAQRYARRAVSPEGDRCDWYAVAPDVMREAVGRWDPEAADDPDGIVRRPWARCAPELYLRQRGFFVALGRTASPDPLRVEETVMSLLRCVLASAYGHEAPAAPSATRRSRADLAEAARGLLARRFRSSETLSELARELQCSPFHLCRTFHEMTGVTLHQYRSQLRLRASLELIEAGMDLTAVAFDLGYSSHSHFTEAFRRAFGAAPSRGAAALLRRGAIPRAT